MKIQQIIVNERYSKVLVASKSVLPLTHTFI